MKILRLRACLSPFRLLEQNILDSAAYEQQEFSSHSSRGWKSKIKMPMDLVSSEGQLPGSQMAPSSCVPKWQKG